MSRILPRQLSGVTCRANTPCFTYDGGRHRYPWRYDVPALPRYRRLHPEFGGPKTIASTIVEGMHASRLPDTEPWRTRFAALADETRLRLLIHMHYAGGEMTVAELASATGVNPNAASQALRTLRDGDMVQASRQGRTVRYRLIDSRLHSLLHAIGAGHAHSEPAE